MQTSQIKQILFQTHVKIGMTLMAFFYIAMFFGTIIMLNPYLETWEKSSRHFAPVQSVNDIDLDAVLVPQLSDSSWPEQGVTVTLPWNGDPAVKIHHRFAQPVFLNPRTGEKLKDEGEGIGTFFTHMHDGKILGSVGMFVLGITCTGVLLLILNGWWLSFKDGKKPASMNNLGIRSMERWHRRLSQWLSPLVFVLALTSAFFGLMFSIGGSGLAYVASDGKAATMHPVLGPVVFPKEKLPPSSKQPAPMMNLNTLLERAGQYYPEIEIQQIVLDRWGQTDARATFQGPLRDSWWLTGRVNRLWIRLNATDGSLLEQRTYDDIHWIKPLLSGFYFFHFLTDTEAPFRLLMFLASFGICLSLGAATIVWIQKKQKRESERIAFHFIWSRFFLALFIGIVPATALMLFTHWSIPQELDERMVWLQGIFFLGWMLTLLWSVAQLDQQKVTGGLVMAGGILLMMTPLVHGLQSGYFFWSAFNEGMMTVASVDIGLLLLGGPLLLISRFLCVKTNLTDKQGKSI